MSDRSERAPDQYREDNSVAEAIKGRGDAGGRAEQVTPPIAEDANRFQPQSPAPPEDAGLLADAELGEKGAGEGA
jgi:hypothetical protein